MQFLIIVEIFSIFLLESEIFCPARFQTLSLLINWIFPNRIIYFWKKLLNKSKICDSIKNLRPNWMFSEKMIRKRI